MKSRLLTLIATLALSASSLPAANIAWVSFHSGDNTPTGPAAAAGFTNAADVGYTRLLAANGHNVTRFVTVADLQNNPDLIAAFNTNDLVIISRSAPSGHFDTLPETAAWNSSVTVPLISMSGYVDRANRLGFHTGDTIPDNNSNNMRLRVSAPIHPIFAGLALNSSNVMVNPYSRRVTYTNSLTGVTNLQLGISVVTSPLIAGGSALATVGTTGDAAFGGMIIGEYPPGITSQRGDMLVARRLVFLSGTRESGITGDGSGIFDLQADGAMLFLNAVTYLTTPQIVQCTLPLFGASNLVAGDTWNFNAGPIGDLPITYQWYHDGAPLDGATGAALSFASLDPTNSGEYQLYITNSLGWATSTVARLDFLVHPPTSITNSLISYWPLDAVIGTKTVDLVSSYDMSLVNLSGADIVAGRWDNAFQFNGTNSHMERLHGTNDALPIYQHPNFTVSIWVNGLVSPGFNQDRRVFTEASLTDIDPMFDLGTHSGGTDGTVDIFIRNDNNVAGSDHRRSTATAYDGTWHNIVYVQRDVGNGTMKAQLWVDGVLDPVVINPIRPLTANTTAFGAVRRAAISALFTGLIDEVAVWNRALSTDEIQILQVTSITNPPTLTQPLAINSFKADLPAVVSGGSTTLRWDVSKDATQVTISSLGDVTGQTSVGIGSQTISPPHSTNYVLTVIRGVDTLSATTSVAVVTGVTAGWTLLDNFDQAQPGNLFASGYWNDTSGSGGQVTNINGNLAVRTISGGISFLNLGNLSVLETQARTLFFRVIAGADTAAGITNLVGLTDKSQRNYGDAFANIGPVLYVTPFTNSGIGVDTNGWYLGARNYPGSDIDYYGNQPVLQSALEPMTIYNIWVDITNVPLADFSSDVFTVYIQKEGGGPRALLFQDYGSDRDLFAVDPVLGGIAPNLDKLVVMGNSAIHSAIFDDFYLSTTGYNDTVPKPASVVVPPGPVSIIWVGNQLQISWSNGTLQSSGNANGPYLDVPGNPTSPYLVSPTGTGTFYRSRQ